MGGRQVVFACFVACLAFTTGLCSLARFTAPVEASMWPTERVLRSVVRIAVQFDGKPGSCSAFSVDERGWFVTAHHCASGSVRIGDVPLTFLLTDPENDLALLETARGGLPALKLGRPPKVGDATFATGYPLSSPSPMVLPSMYQGVFDAWARGERPAAIFIGNTIPGMSGGPIVDTSGEVIGVVLGGGNPSQVYQNVGFGAPYAALRKLLLRKGD